MQRAKFDIIPSHKIDAVKWDDCVKHSKANMIYATYLYLQHMADHWSGLVMDDYAAVMPVVWRKKWNIRYVYDAPFIQQLGLFGTYNAEDLKQAIHLVMKYIKYGDLFVNHTNAIQPFLPSASAATNLILPLNKSYEKIKEGYNNHLKNKLKKGAAQSLCCLNSEDVELAVQTFQQLYAMRFPAATAKNYQKLAAVAKQLLASKQCFVKQVMSKESGLLAVALLFKDDNRIYNILPSTTTAGRAISAMHFLLDDVMKEFANTSLIFDFEGSDVPGIKAFYQSFGAVNEPYYHVHYNHLPAPFKWLKR